MSGQKNNQCKRAKNSVNIVYLVIVHVHDAPSYRGELFSEVILKFCRPLQSKDQEKNFICKKQSQ